MSLEVRPLCEYAYACAEHLSGVPARVALLLRFRHHPVPGATHSHEPIPRRHLHVKSARVTSSPLRPTVAPTGCPPLFQLCFSVGAATVILDRVTLAFGDTNVGVVNLLWRQGSVLDPGVRTDTSLWTSLTPSGGIVVPRTRGASRRKPHPTGPILSPAHQTPPASRARLHISNIHLSSADTHPSQAPPSTSCERCRSHWGSRWRRGRPSRCGSFRPA